MKDGVVVVLVVLFVLAVCFAIADEGWRLSYLGCQELFT